VRNRVVLSLFVAGCVAGLSADGTPYLLLQKPTLSRTHIAFVYAGDLWTVPREGGETVLFLHVLAKTNGGWNASLVSGIVAAFAALAVLFWIIITSGC